MMDDYGNEIKAQWREIDKLKAQCAKSEKEIAVICAEQERQREQNDKLMRLLAEMNGKIDTLATQIAEARGGLRLGRWLFASGMAVIGTGCAVWALVKQ